MCIDDLQKKSLQQDPSIQILLRAQQGNEANFRYLDRMLFKDDGNDSLRLAVPENIRTLIMKLYHDHPLAGHLAVHKTVSRIAD